MFYLNISNIINKSVIHTKIKDFINASILFFYHIFRINVNSSIFSLKKILKIIIDISKKLHINIRNFEKIFYYEKMNFSLEIYFKYNSNSTSKLNIKLFLNEIVVQF